MSDFKKDNPNQTKGNLTSEKTNQGSNKKQPNPNDTTEKHRKPNEEMPNIGDHSKLRTKDEADGKTNGNRDKTNGNRNETKGNRDETDGNRDKSDRFDKQTNPKKSDKSGI